MNRHWGFSYGFRYVPIYRRPIDKWAQAQFGIIDNLICRDFGSTPGDTYCLIYNGYFQKLDLKGFLTAPTPRPSIGQPSMDGHWSALAFWNMAWFTLSVANWHISGTMRKPFQFSFQNIRQNWKISGSQNVMVNAMGASSPEVDPKSRKKINYQ